MFNFAFKFGIDSNQEFTYILGILVFLLLGFSLNLEAITPPDEPAPITM